MNTPVISHHARARCEEMGISTKVAKRIIQNPHVVRPSGSLNCYRSDDYPEYAVMYDEESNVVVTVLFQCVEDYERDGNGYRPISREEYERQTRSKSP